jgi:hypothetical protein
MGLIYVFAQGLKALEFSSTITDRTETLHEVSDFAWSLIQRYVNQNPGDNFHKGFDRYELIGRLPGNMEQSPVYLKTDSLYDSLMKPLTYSLSEHELLIKGLEALKCEECPVCFGTMVEDIGTVCILPCSHVLCEHCSQTSLALRSICPVCRTRCDTNEDPTRNELDSNAVIV